MRKSIPAVGDLKNTDVAWLENQLRANGIDPIWDSESLENANVVLICITTHLDEKGWPPNIKLALHEYWNKKILMALFDGGIKPAILIDIKEANFKTSNRAIPLDSLIKAIHAFVR